MISEKKADFFDDPTETHDKITSAAATDQQLDD